MAAKNRFRFHHFSKISYEKFHFKYTSSVGSSVCVECITAFPWIVEYIFRKYVLYLDSEIWNIEYTFMFGMVYSQRFFIMKYFYCRGAFIVDIAELHVEMVIVCVHALFFLRGSKNDFQKRLIPQKVTVWKNIFFNNLKMQK